MMVRCNKWRECDDIECLHYKDHKPVRLRDLCHTFSEMCATSELLVTCIPSSRNDREDV